MREYTCGMCDETYETADDWNSFDAAKEMLEKFPETKNDPTEIVCSDCYDVVIKWLESLPEEDKQNLRK